MKSNARKTVTGQAHRAANRRGSSDSIPAPSHTGPIVKPSVEDYIENAWKTAIVPALAQYIRIPCLSPAFDAEWETNGHLDRAVTLMLDWVRQELRRIPDASAEVVRLLGRTPVILVEIPGAGDEAVLVYGHLDKQPEMTGWAQGRAAWIPTLEGDRLYGRGGADDGYALFSAVVAVLALHDGGLEHARMTILIEGCEESGSGDLPHYLEHLAARIGEPSVVIALDAGSPSYDQLWLTTSLRGQVTGTLTVRVLNEGVHSGDAAGVVPSSFRIARRLLSRLEDADTGVIVDDFHTPIPQARRQQALAAGTSLGAAFSSQLPFANDTHAVSNETAELILNRTWRPQLSITGMDGLPATAHAPAVMQPAIALKLSLRLPPTLDPEIAAARLKSILELHPPYRCEASFRIDMTSRGWHSHELQPWLARTLESASLAAFGASTAMIGGGGGIPFLALLGEKFPRTQFVVMGVLGPQSNAHGPNEFLHIPTAKRITAVVAQIALAAGQRRGSIQ